MTNQITLNKWYQLDFKIERSAKITLQKIAKLIDSLKKQNLINKWFYLFENTTIRIRLNSTNPTDLEVTIFKLVKKFGLDGVPEKPFEPYVESSDNFACVEVVETFANIMANLTSLTIKRLSGANFSNFGLMERLTHCISNNIYGSKTETYILLKLLGIDFHSRDNPEQTILDDNQQYLMGNKVTFTTSPFNLPKK